MIQLAGESTHRSDEMKTITNEKTRAATRYRWDDLPADQPMEKITRRRIIGSQMMISEVNLAKGFFVASHTHVNEQFAVVLSGRMRFHVGDVGGKANREIIVEAGDVLHLPGNVPHSAEALEASRLLDLFSPPSDTTGVDHARTAAPVAATR
jgi:quercetin dioxygenase-like cupin family protein